MKITIENGDGSTQTITMNKYSFLRMSLNKEVGEETITIYIS